MPYLGRPVTNAGQFEIIDDISSGFDGSDKSFTLQVGGTDIQPDAANVTIVLDGVVQIPSSAYSVTGSTLNFTEAPTSGTEFHGVLAGQSQFIESDFITNTMIKSTANISGSKINTDFSAQTVKAAIFDGMISGSAQLADDISGSFSKTHLSSKISGIVSASVLSSPSQGTIRLATNGVNTDVDSGLQTGDSPTFAGGTITGDFAVGGTLTAQEVHTEFESASILFTSGSTQFGNSSDDVHEFKGNVISGSSTSTASLAMISLADKIEHIGDTNNTIEFGTDEIKLRTSGGSRLIVRDSNVELYNDLIVANQTFIGGSADEGYSLLLNIEGAGGTDDVPGILFKNTSASNNEEIMSLLGTQGSDSVAAINIKREANADDAYIDFMTQANGGSMTERLRITSAGHVSASGNISIIKGNAMLNVEEVGGSKAYLFSGGSFTALRTTSNTPLQFGANYSSADTMYIVGDKVGIGTNNPTYPLTISDGGGLGFEFSPDHGGGGYNILQNYNRAGSAYVPVWYVASEHRFYSGGTEVAQIDSSGNVGIGTDTPLATLHVEHTTDDTDENGNIALTVGGGASGDVRHYWGVNNSSNYAYYGAVEHGTQYVPLVLQPNGSNVGIGQTNPLYKLDMYIASATHIARFVNGGNNYNMHGILIACGKNSPASAGDCNYIFFQDGNGTDAGGIRNSSTVANPEFFNGSDLRMKKDVAETKVNGLETINAIPLKEWNWNSKTEKPKTKIGIVADDLEKVLPELVSKQTPLKGWEHCVKDGEEPLKTVPTETQLTLILMKAVQELSAKIDELENR